METAGPALGEAIRHSRNDARGAGTSPIPYAVREALSLYFDRSLLDRVQYRVGQGHELSVQANSIRFGDAAGVALIDTIVFSHPNHVNNVALWAHELAHVQQYQRWGLTDFAKRYVRDSGAVEREADEISRSFMNRYNARYQQTYPPNNYARSVPPPPPMIAMTRICRNGWYYAFTPVPVPIGQACFVPGWGYGVASMQ